MFNFLQKKFIGLDIADHTIEAVEIVRTGTGIKALNASRVVLEQGILTRGRIKHKEKLVKAVKKALLSAAPNSIAAKKVYCALPESQVYTHTFDIVLEGKDVTAQHAVEKRREELVKKIFETIPVEKDKVVFDHRIVGIKALDHNRIKIESLVVAADREVVLEWQNLFEELKIDIDYFDIETLAIFRSLFPKPHKKPVCIIDIGANTTNVAIFEKNDLRFSYTIATAGNALTNAIAGKLNFDKERAEREKIKNGLIGENKQIVGVIDGIIKNIIKDIKESIQYFEEKRQRKVHEIILVGGTARLKGLCSFFAKTFDISVRRGKPSFTLSKKQAEKSFFYIGALGAALRPLSKKWKDRHPTIGLVQKSSVIRDEAKAAIEEESIQKQEEKKIKTFRCKEKIHEKNVRVQKIILFLIVIGGIVLLWGAYYYRVKERVRQDQEIQSKTLQYRLIQSFDILVPIAVDESEYSSDKISGRVIQSTLAAAGDYDEAVAKGRIQAEKELKDQEVLWQEPISKVPESLAFPLAIQWLAYPPKDVNIFFGQGVEILNKENIEYALNNIVKLKLELSDNENIYFLTGRVTVSLNQLIKFKEE